MDGTLHAGGRLTAFGVVCAGLLAAACGDDSPAMPDADVGPAEWTVVHQNLSGSLMSVWGTSADDVWAVGGDPGDGPMVIHWDGSTWTRLDTGSRGDLWWVHGFDGGPVYMGGKDGRIFRYDGAFTLMPTPGVQTVFGIWGSSPSDVWAVGGREGGGGGAFAWRLDGDQWVDAAGFPAELADKALWKMWGSGADDAWMVGDGGTAVHWDGNGLEPVNLGGGESLFTVHYADGVYAAVGGFATALVFENGGSSWDRVDDGSFAGMVGVCLVDGGRGFAVGNFAAFLERTDGVWSEAEGPATSETLHAIWVDPDGGLWAVGGQVQVTPFVRGVLAYRGNDIPEGELQ
jgi:hypothetical protein